jgi:ribosome biogenesis ATPase
LPVPDAPARTKILRLQTAKMNLAQDVDFEILGKVTPGFVGADLQALAREAGSIAISRIIKANELTLNANASEQELTLSEIRAIENKGAAANEAEALTLPGPDLSKLFIEMSDLLQATKTIQPTAKREGFAVAPEVSWSDIGALAEVREELKHNLLEPIAHPDRFRALGLDVPAGVLFFGPPGCGKTLLAKAIANESGANFISVKGPELLNMFVGESESRVRQVFARARASAPCVIFFDELDALCPKRSSGFEGSGGSGNGVSERVVNQLLTELDGLESRRDVYIIAATNRLELIDDAMLRPGRLGNLLYVPLPTAADRVSILQALTRKVAMERFDPNAVPIDLGSQENPPPSEGVKLEQVAHDPRCEGFSGADLAALVREAGLAVIKEISAREESGTAAPIVEEIIKIKARHFEKAFEKIKPSVNKSDRSR